MKKHWIILSLVGIVIILAVVSSFFLSRPQGDAIYASVKIEANQLDEGSGNRVVDPGTDFSIKLDYRVSEDELRAMLEVEPEISGYTLQGGKRSKSWTLTPESPLLDNTVYTFQVKNLSGQVVSSFAFQTRSDLLVAEVYPTDGERYVQTDTGIEIAFNASGVDLSNHFLIEPVVSGTFEISGYRTIFKPTVPLEPNNIYRVTLKAGLAAGNGMTLQEDYVFSFETTGKGDNWDYTQLHLSGDFAETFLTGDPLVVSMLSGSNLEGLEFHTQVYQYPSIDPYIEALKDRTQFYRERTGSTRNQYQAPTEGLELVMEFDSPLVSNGSGWNMQYLPLPGNLPEGWYLVCISGENAEGTEQFVQKMLQVRNMSVYTQSTDGDTLIWLNDPVSGEPFAGRAVRVTDTETGENVEAAADQDGIIRLRTGEWESAYLEILEGTQTGYFQEIPLSVEEETPLSEQYYSAHYADREQYQPSDTVRFWGMLRPRRDTASMPETVTACLLEGWGLDPVIASQELTVAENGTYTGTFQLEDLASGSYELAIRNQEGKTYRSDSIYVEAYQKPAYIIDVSTEKPYYYANEPIKILLSAQYYDGTPVSNGKLRVTSALLGLTGAGEGLVQLDENGQGSVTAFYQPGYTGDLSGWSPEYVSLDVTSGDEQMTAIYTFSSVMVLPSNVAAKLSMDEQNNLTIYTAHIDETRLVDAQGNASSAAYSGGYDLLRGAAIDLPVSVLVRKTEYIRVPDGTYYDPVEKKQVQRFRTERQETVADTLQGHTSGGRLVFTGLPYENTDTVFYSYELVFSGGIQGDVMQVYTPYRAYYASNSADREFMFLPGNDNYASLRLSEELKMGLYENGNRQRGDGRVLYTVVQRKMLHADVLDAGEDYIFTMDESFLPNLSVVGAYFDGRHVYDINDCSIRYEYDERTLKLDIQTNEEAYAPGKTVEATIGLSDASGRPVAGSICVGVVDESVFALQAQQVNLAWQVYQGIYYPSVTRMLSYTPYDLTVNESMDVGGMGGGGGDSGYIRKEFVDTALFQTVEAGEDGKAQVTFTLPDNIGSWRITAVAVTDDLKAGDGRSNIISSLPFYVQPIYSDTYLEGDDIAVTAAVGGLDYAQLEGTVEYTVEILDESEKTIDQLTASGEVGDRVPVNFGKYSAGNYIMRVTAQCGDYLDAEQHPFSVLKQGTTITVIETMPLDEVSGISSVRWPVGVQVYDQRLKPFMDGLQELSGQGNSARVEVLAAAWRAQVLYNNMLPEADRRNIPYDSRLEDLITEQGVKPLAAAEPSAVLTAKLLVAAPSMVEQQQGALNLFQQTLTDPAATQDERVMAYVGLAALKQPVLLDITRLAEDDTLTDTQRLWVAVGLAKLGDFTSAHKIYDSLSKSILTEGNLKYLKADSRADEIQATAAALVLTSTISSPDADAFMQYFLQGENSRARVEGVLPNLEMLCYLEQYSVPSADKAGRFSCVIDGQIQEISLGEKGVKAMAFTKDAFAQADITPIEGELYAAVSYVAYTTLENATSGSQGKVQIERTYTPLDGDSITRASRVRVDLRVTFSDDAPEGCYYLSDRIPSGLRFLYGDYVANTGKTLTGWMENEGQMVYGVIHRELLEEDFSEPENPVIINSPYMPAEGESVAVIDDNTFIFTYYVSAALPGQYVIEPAYITPYQDGIAAKSESGRIEIG